MFFSNKFCIKIKSLCPLSKIYHKVYFRTQQRFFIPMDTAFKLCMFELSRLKTCNFYIQKVCT